jgi:purine-binding chemotaxis protein CheW
VNETLPEAKGPEQDTIEVLVFQLDQHKFSVEIDYVVEIIRYREPTSVPNTVSFLDGIISFRGRMVPVINGRKRLGSPPAKPNITTSIIVVRDGSELYGVLVDSSLQVIQLHEIEIRPVPTENHDLLPTEMIRGSFVHKNQEIFLLNLELFLQF